MIKLQQRNDFSKGSIVSNIIKLAVPMTVAQMINVLYNIVDRIYIGRIPKYGTESLTALGICLPAITIIIAFANLVGMGGAPLFSIERGRGDEDEAEVILGNSFTLLLVIGVFLTVFLLAVRRPLLMLLGASEVTYPYAVSYLTIYMCGNIFVMLSLGLNSFINAQGFGKTGMCTVAIGAGLNIILDPVFIFVFQMGVKGAAIATLISQLASAVWTICFLTGNKTICRIRLKNMKCQAKRVRKILTLGLAGFTVSVTNSTVQMVCNRELQIYGGDIYVGVMTIINSVREVVMLPVTGIQNGTQPVISFNYGAKEYERVKEAIRFVTKLLIIIMLGCWAVISGFPGVWIRIFNQDPEILSAGVMSMHIYFFGFFLMAFQCAGQVTFTALGRSKNAIFFSIFRKVIIVVPLTILLPCIHGLGVNGVFLAEPISNLIGGLACYITMYLTVYKKL